MDSAPHATPLSSGILAGAAGGYRHIHIDAQPVYRIEGNDPVGTGF